MKMEFLCINYLKNNNIHDNTYITYVKTMKCKSFGNNLSLENTKLSHMVYRYTNIKTSTVISGSRFGILF